MAYSTVAVTPGVGAGIAVDAISGSQFQRVKLAWGAEGVANDANAATPLPISAYFGANAVAAALGLPVSDALLNPTDLTEVAINIASSGDNSIVSATASQKTRLYGFFLRAAGTVSLKWRDGTTDLHPAFDFISREGWIMAISGRPWLTTSANSALQINLSAAIQVSGRAYYLKSA